MKKILFLSALLLAITVKYTRAQSVQDVNGMVITAKSYTEVQGSPFLTEDWSNGMVKFADGRTYKDMKLKYNELDDELTFLDKKQEALVFVDPVAVFKIELSGTDHTFKNGFKNIPGSTAKSYFEILSDGTAQLIKKHQKAIAESKEYNSAVVTKRFEQEIKYYLVIADKVTPVKKDKKSILTAIGNHQPELEAYIKTNNLNLKNDDDLGKLVNYYNSL